VALFLPTSEGRRDDCRLHFNPALHLVVVACVYRVWCKLEGFGVVSQKEIQLSSGRLIRITVVDFVFLRLHFEISTAVWNHHPIVVEKSLLGSGKIMIQFWWVLFVFWY